MAIEITTPTGRIVWGHPARPVTKKNQRTKQVVLDKEGKPVQQYAFGLAISKAEFQQHLWPALSQEAATFFPQGVPQDFSWKFRDGDGIDKKGRPYSSREGYAGNIVLTISTEAFAPSLYKKEGNAFHQIEANQIKTGDYVAASIVVKYNGQTAGNGAGIYINPKGIVLVGYGNEIVSSGQDPDEMFANVNFALPAGASAMPVAPAGMPATYAPQVAQIPGVGVAPLPQPAHDFVHNAGQQFATVPQAQQPAVLPAQPFPGFPGAR